MRKNLLKAFFIGLLCSGAARATVGPVIESVMQGGNANINNFTDVPNFPQGINIVGAFYNSNGTSSPSSFNVRYFGAVGDGVTDDSAAADAACNAAGSGVVFFPKGNYKISLNVASRLCSILGEDNGTKFVQISTSAFMLTYKDITNTKRRWIKNIWFQGSASLGRGIYENCLGFLSVQNCRFDGLEYGFYGNSSEWNHFSDDWFYQNKYGCILTTLNNDVLGNNPSTVQNSVGTTFSQCAFWNNQLGFYNDNPNDSFGDTTPALAFFQTEFVQNNCAFAEFNSDKEYIGAQFSWCWFEQNNNDATTQTFNGNTVFDGDFTASGGSIYLTDIQLAGRQHFINKARITGTDIHVLSGNTAIVSTDTTVGFDHVIADENNGAIYDWFYATNLENFRADRGAMCLTTNKTSFTLGLSTQNAITTGSTSGVFGSMPQNIVGAPAKSFVFNDGLYANSSIQIDGVNTNEVQWQATVKAGKFYAISFALKSGTTTTTGKIQVVSGGQSTFSQGIINLSSQSWKTYGGIGQPSTSGASQLLFLWNSHEIVKFCCLQVVEFPTMQEAKDYLNSTTFALQTVEVNNREYASTTFPATGTWTVGDITWNTNPAATFIGWVCTVAGTPGTWKTFGAVTP